MENKRIKTNEKEQEPNINIIKIKKSIVLISLIFCGLFGMQIFQVGAWSLNPGLKYPYLSFIGDPRYNMGISCGTPYKCVLTLHYGTNKNNINQTIKENKENYIHQFALKNLNASTKYYWYLSCNDENIKIDFFNKIYSFKTAPEPTLKEKIRLVAIGDTRPDIFGFSRFSHLNNMILKDNPDFIINVGDIVMSPGMSWQWDKFFYEIKGFAESGIPYMISMGNHEYEEGEWLFGKDKGETYKKYMFFPGKETYYAFNYSNAAFIFIDTNSDGLTEEQYSKVEQWLSAANKSNLIDWIIVSGHHARYHANGYDDRLIKFENLFKKYNVNLYIAGHVHHYARLKIDGITYLVEGGGGAETDIWLETTQNVEASAITFEYTLIEIDNNELTLKTIDHSGIVIDSDTIKAGGGE
ncbi:MAG: metallophosphoesterase [Promethearchaeota archaeon]